VSVTRVPAELRERVRERAKRSCEYCLLAEEQASFGFEADHIIGEQHRGLTVDENLAWCCFPCNRFKGPNIASVDPVTGELARLFNPRSQIWSEHFQIDAAQLVPLTPEGRVTVETLKLNSTKRLEVRETLASLGQYPLRNS